MKIQRSAYAFLSVSLFAAMPAMAGSLIDVQFTQTGSPSYSGAAVLGSSGDYWNTFEGDSAVGGFSASNQSLEFSDGSASSVTVSYSTPDGFYDATGGDAVFQGSSYQNLMDAYMDADRYGEDGAGTVSFSNLAPLGQYQLILYSAGNNPGNIVDFTANGQSQTVVQGSSPTLVDGTSYAAFDVDANASGQILITLAAGGVEGSGEDADLNGIQLEPVSVPEPGTFAILAGTLGLAGYRRRRS